MTTLISSEFLINDTTDDGLASVPDIGIDAQGNFVVVWEQLGSTTSNGVLVRRFDSTGDPEGDLIVIDPVTSIGDPVVAVATDGRFVVVWDDGGSGNDISIEIYQSDGDLDVSEFEAGEDDDVTETIQPDIAIDASNGDFVVTWVQDDDDGDRSIVAQKFTIDGEEDGNLITVETIDDNDLLDGQSLGSPAVAMNDSGDFVIVWQQNTQDDDDNSTDIFAQRYNSSGSPVGSTLLVNTEQENGQSDPDVAIDASGDFTIVWFSQFIDRLSPTPDIDAGIYARQYNSNGNPRGDQFVVAAPDPFDGSALEPTVAMDSSGDTLIVWRSSDVDIDADGFDIFAQEYNSAGTAVGTPFRINDEDDVAGDQIAPAIAITSGGNAVVVWESTSIASTSDNILGQRVSLSGTTSGNDNNSGSDDNSGNNNNNTGDNTVPDETITGNNADNFLSGSAAAELIQGLGGDDTIFGKLGDDELFGGNGRDRIQGDGGDDKVTGNAGADELLGNAGADQLFGGQGRDNLKGGGGADTLDGEAGPDTLIGNGGTDILMGGDGVDRLEGGGGNDSLQGEIGRDTLLGQGGDDFLVGGENADLLIGGRGSDALYGGSGNDTLRGGSGTSNFFDGDAGNDKLIGQRGSIDTFAIIPGNGLDQIRNFTLNEDFLGFEDSVAAFSALEFVRDNRGTIVKVDGERVALIRGIDLTINVLFSQVVSQLTTEQLAQIPTN